jgi:hypothetical protein
VLICTAPPNQPTAERLALGALITNRDIVMTPQPDRVTLGAAYAACVS